MCKLFQAYRMSRGRGYETVAAGCEPEVAPNKLSIYHQSSVAASGCSEYTRRAVPWRSPMRQDAEIDHTCHAAPRKQEYLSGTVLKQPASVGWGTLEAFWAACA